MKFNDIITFFTMLTIPAVVIAAPYDQPHAPEMAPPEHEMHVLTGNPSNDKLLTMPENGQAAMLSKATGYSCVGKRPFYMGTETHQPNENVSLWSLTCEYGGKEFLIAIAPDAKGSTRVISCSMLRKEPWKCYQKLEEKK